MTSTLNPEPWLEEHGNYLFRYAVMRLHDKDVAEDMVQETLQAALKGKDRFKGEASMRSWLVGILKHKILDHMRSSGRELSVSGLLSEGDESADLFDEKGKWRQEPTPWQDDPRTALERKEFLERWCAVCPSCLIGWRRSSPCASWKGRKGRRSVISWRSPRLTWVSSYTAPACGLENACRRNSSGGQPR